MDQKNLDKYLSPQYTKKVACKRQATMQGIGQMV